MVFPPNNQARRSTPIYSAGAGMSTGIIHIPLSTRIAVGLLLVGTLLLCRNSLESRLGERIDDFFVPLSDEEMWDDGSESSSSGRMLSQAAPASARSVLAGRSGRSLEDDSANSSETTDTETTTTVKGPGQTFGKVALIVAMSIFFTLIGSLMALDAVLAKNRGKTVEST
mmetsp:Transcript_62284/g.131687  ORF Transcript_62284/g.131687 Transcript_62284/m.131687 type:complete len:170 (-) Transcript_62284:249-758(-)